MTVPPTQPTLRTARLVLRPFGLDDAAAVQRLAGAAEVADTTLNIPHPYLDGMAETWIGTHVAAYQRREQAVFAITFPTDELIGAVGLRIELAHRRAELGYWIAVPLWGQGYATEAARAAIEFGFVQLGLNRIYASHLTRNAPSGKVMTKAGMHFEGTHRQHTLKAGRFEDLAIYGLLRSQWTPAAGG